MKRDFFVLALVFGCCLTLNAYGKKDAVPESVTSAKTIYVVNSTPNKVVGDVAYDELEKWGRYTVVHDAESADLTLHFMQFSDTINGSSITKIVMFVTAGQSDDRLFQSEHYFALKPSGTIQKDVDSFKKWVGGK